MKKISGARHQLLVLLFTNHKSMNSSLTSPRVAGVACAGIAALVGARYLLKPVFKKSAKDLMVSFLKEADIIIGRDIEVLDDAMWLDWMNNGMLAIGESYMAKQWEAKIPLDEILYRLMALPSSTKRKMFKSWNAAAVALWARVFNEQSEARAGIVGARHYDLGNDFFKLWLDKNMQYSCAYWKDAKNLDEAQEQKLHLIAKKLKLEPGMKVLEIGCGWGGLSCFFAKHYGVHMTGITISNEQLKGAREWAERDNVSDLTSFEYCDYRKMEGQYDRVVSIAMLEAVGYKNLDEYYTVIRRCLKDGGLALVHSIAANRSTKTAHQLWITRYIFPNGFLPSLMQMCEFAEKKFVVEDVHNIGPDYDNTLMAWHEGFQQGRKDGTIANSPDSDVFNRMWEFYLVYCAAGFRARTIQLYQQVLSKHRPGRYDAPR